jgi:hypothetical protein
MKYTQLIKPRLTTQGDAGFSLEHVQSAYKAPVKFFTAWTAWENCQFTHGPLEELPNAYVPVWFYTTFKDNLTPLGHVLIWDPYSKKLWGTPRHGRGKHWFDFAEVATPWTRYVGWSEDLNGVRIVRPKAVER